MLDDKYIDSLVKQAADFGNGKIHIIVNNAGYTWDGVIHKVRQKNWNDSQQYTTNSSSPRQPTNNGTPSSPCTTPNPSNSSAPQHPTSASKTALLAMSSTSPQPPVFTATQAKQTMPWLKLA